MTLKINHVAGKVGRPRAQEMIEGDFVKRRRGGVSRNVAAETAVRAVGVDEHRHSDPASVTLDASLDFPITAEWRLLLFRDCIDVRSRNQPWRFNPLVAQPLCQLI